MLPPLPLLPLLPPLPPLPLLPLPAFTRHFWVGRILAPKLRPKYIVAIEERVYEVSGDTALLVGVPDVSVQSSLSLTRSPQSNLAVVPTPQPIEVLLPLPEILTEAYLEIRAVDTEEVVTIIEVLSPKNKQVGIGRLQYETKRLKILASMTHFVEIDLLPQGNSMAMVGNFGQSHYRIVVSKKDKCPCLGCSIWAKAQCL